MKTTRIFGMGCGIIVAGLLAGCANVQEEFESAVYRDDLGAAEKWLARGATVNSKGKWGFGDFSLLDDVTHFGHHEEMVYWLLEHGATAGNGVVPWEAIAMMGNSELLRIRLEKGANVNERKTMKTNCEWNAFGPIGRETRKGLSKRCNTCMNME